MSEYQVTGHTISEYGSLARVNYFLSPKVSVFLGPTAARADSNDLSW